MTLVAQTFDQLINFTRTSAATFVGSNGLIQNTPASVNLLTFTQEFDNAAWAKLNVTVTANSATAPDGTSTADTLTDDATSGQHRVNQFSGATSTTYAFSIYVKANTHNFLQLLCTSGSGTNGWFTAIANLATGAVTQTGNGSSGTLVSSSITSVGNGWYRISVVGSVSTAAPVFRIAMVPAASGNLLNATDGTVSYAGTSTSLFLWGAQLEVGSTATAYTRNFGGVFPPRFDYDPITLLPRGLLVEEQRTNLLLRSEEFGNASWIKATSTVAEDADVAPDGTTTAEKLVVNNSITLGPSSGAGVRQNVTKAASNITYTFSTFAKAAEFNSVFLYVLNNGATGGARCQFNLGAGTASTPVLVGTGFSAVSATITNAASGWYRCTITVTTDVDTTLRNSILPADTVATTGNGTSGIFLWGAQLEAGAFATSYIPTVASQVTRAADVVAIAAPNFSPFYNQREGTFVVNVAFANAPATTTFSLYSVSDNTSSERIFAGTGPGAGGNINTVVTDGGVVQAQTINGGLSTAGTYKYANIYRLDDFGSVVNGGAVITDTSGTVPIVDRLYIGASSTGTAQINGHIRSIDYYPVRLTNATLQALTA